MQKSTIRLASIQDDNTESNKVTTSKRRRRLLAALCNYALLGCAAGFLLSLIEWVDLNIRLTPVFESISERAVFTAYFSLNLVVASIIGVLVGVTSRIGSFLKSKLQSGFARRGDARLAHRVLAGLVISVLAAAILYLQPAVFRYVLGVIREAEKVPQLTHRLLNYERMVVYLSLLGLLVSCWVTWSIARSAGRMRAWIRYVWLAQTLTLLAAAYYADSRIEVQLYEPSLHRSLFLLELTLALAFVGSLYFWRFQNPGIQVSPARRSVFAGVATAIAAATLFTFVYFDKNQNLKTQIFFRTTQTKNYFRLVQWALDFDRDGYSSLLGGGDADDKRADINPSAAERIEDGEDNNGTGGDLSRQQSTDWLQDHNRHNTALNEDATRFNVIFIFVDALRADHLSVYGYGRDTSPNLRKFADRATVFENGFTPSPYTFEAFPKFMKSSYWDARVETWTEVFARNGYNTVMFPRRISTMLRYVKGISKVVRDGSKGLKETVDTTIDVLGNEPLDKPFCAFVYVSDPHMPYANHDEYNFGSSVVDRYDGEIAYTDFHLGRLFDWLEQSGKIENTVVALMSDHGESLGERGVYKHTTQLYNEQMRVPIIVHVPKIPSRRVTNYVSTIDLGSTLLNAVGIACPPEYMGTSLLPLMRGEMVTRLPVYGEQTMTEDSRYVPLDQYVYPATKKYVIISQDGYKLIYNRDVNSFELFNLKEDPSELRNLYHSLPERAADMTQQLFRFVDVVSANRPPDADERKYNLGLRRAE